VAGVQILPGRVQRFAGPARPGPICEHVMKCGGPDMKWGVRRTEPYMKWGGPYQVRHHAGTSLALIPRRVPPTPHPGIQLQRSLSLFAHVLHTLTATHLPGRLRSRRNACTISDHRNRISLCNPCVLPDARPCPPAGRRAQRAIRPSEVRADWKTASGLLVLESNRRRSAMAGRISRSFAAKR
jgi:hypothetical protein